MKQTRRRLQYVLVIAIIMLIIPAMMIAAQNGENNGKVTICHVAGDPENGANYETLVVDENALNGHFAEDGSPRANHAYDTMGPCPTEAESTAETTEIPTTETTAATSARAVPAETTAITCTDWLVYHTYVTGDLEIYRLGAMADGGNPNLTQGQGADDFGPSLASDRDWLVFTSNRDGNYELYLARTDGTLLDRITDSEATETDAMWSPTRGEAAYQMTHNGQTDLMLVDLNTEEARELVADGAHNTDPYWAPDGNSLLFVSDRDGTSRIYSYDRQSGTVTQISQEDGHHSEPQYNITGDLIAYRAELENGNSVVRIMNADGSHVRTISEEAGKIGDLAWSPDGAAIAYHSNRDGNLDVYVYFMDMQSSRQLTQNDVDNYGPTWYCETLTLAFTSHITGDANLFATLATPHDGAPLNIMEDTMQLTADEVDEFYAVQSPSEENGSNTFIEAHLAQELASQETETEVPVEGSGGAGSAPGEGGGN